MEAVFGPLLALLEPAAMYEHLMIAMVPAGIAVLLTPVFNENVPRVSVKCRPFLASTKLAVACGMLTAQLVNFGIWCNAALFHSLASLIAALLSFLASLIVVVLLHSTTQSSFPPAVFHNMFLATTLIYDLAMARHSVTAAGSIGVFQLAIVLLKWGLDEEESGARIRPNVWLSLPLPGLLSLSGLRRDFGMEDLPDPDAGLSSKLLFVQFQRHWRRANRKSSKALIKAIMRTMSWIILSIVPLRLCHVLFTLAQPLLLRQILTSTFRGDISLGTTIFNIVATVIVWVGMGALKLAFTRQSDYVATSTRAILISAIYHKMTKLSGEQLRKSTVLSQLKGGMRSIEVLINSTQDIVSASIQIWLGMCLLWPSIGATSLLVFVPTLMVSVATFLSGKKEAQSRKLFNKRREARVATMANILGQLRNIKMIGLSTALSNYLQKQRKSEVDALLKERSSRMTEFSLSAFNHSMTPFFVIAGSLFWARPSPSFDAVETFTCFMLVRIISDAFNLAMGHLSYGQSGHQILSRIQQFLWIKEVQDERLYANVPADENPNAASTAAVELILVTVMSRSGDVILLDVTMRAYKCSITMVFGAVASGKSTLLRLMLGEVKPDGGRIKVASMTMVYCGQEVWLQCLTIRATIIGNSHFQLQWYCMVTRACCLDADLDRLPDGDGTLANGPECRLSLSLKQRIALARALYGLPTTMILDDPLSAVNFSTAARIYDRLFGIGGIIFRWECTVIIATNTFGHLKFADAIYTVGYDGRVKEEDISEFTSPENTVAVLSDSNGTFDGGSYTVDEALEPAPALAPQDLNQEVAGTKSRNQDVGLYSYFQQPAGNFLVVAWPITAAIAAILEKMPEIFWGLSLSQDAMRAHHLVGYALFGIANLICNKMVAHLFFKHINKKSAEVLHWRLVQTIMRATPAFLATADTGLILKLFDEDIGTISRGLPITFMQFCFLAVSLIADAVILSCSAKYAAIFAVALCALLHRIHSRYLPYSQRLRDLERQSLAEVTAHCDETTAGIEHIRAFRRKPELIEALHQTLTKSQRPYYYVFEAQRQLEYTVSLFIAAFGGFIVALVHLYPESSSAAALGLALVSVADLTRVITFMAQIWGRLDEYLGAVYRVRIFCNTTPVEVEPASAEPPPTQWPSVGEIEFSNVTTDDGYESVLAAIKFYGFTDGEIDRNGDGSPGSLVSASIGIEATEKVVVSSRWGSGQTSMMLAVLKMIDYSGSIKLDGRDIKTVSNDILRSRITTITRDVIALKGSVRMNLDPFSMKPHFCDADFISMLNRVKLWDKVQRCGGLDADMEAMHFSLGQKQLLNVARGALQRRRADTKVVLIDEAVTTLDKKTDERIQDFIDGEFAGCTVVMVTNDVEAIKTADAVLMVDQGTISCILERRSEAGDWTEEYAAV